VLPISAGAIGRLPAIAVKLNGVSANTKPSRGRSSIMFHTPGADFGCMLYSSCAYLALNRQKSISSHAESISAWCAVFDWPCMVAAFIRARQVPASSSAAFSSTAARASQRIAVHSRRASSAARIARWATSSVAAWNRATTCLWRCGIVTSRILPVRIRWPPTTHGISTTCDSIAASAALSWARSRLPGA
jgi:hypothetical protein